MHKILDRQVKNAMRESNLELAADLQPPFSLPFEVNKYTHLALAIAFSQNPNGAPRDRDLGKTGVRTNRSLHELADAVEQSDAYRFDGLARKIGLYRKNLSMVDLARFIHAGLEREDPAIPGDKSAYVELLSRIIK